DDVSIGVLITRRSVVEMLHDLGHVVAQLPDPVSPVTAEVTDFTLEVAPAEEPLVPLGRLMHVLHLRVDAGQGRGELLQRRRIDCERCHRRFVLDRKWEYVTPGQLMEERMASSVCWYWVPAL